MALYPSKGFADAWPLDARMARFHRSHCHFLCPSNLALSIMAHKVFFYFRANSSVLKCPGLKNCTQIQSKPNFKGRHVSIPQGANLHQIRHQLVIIGQWITLAMHAWTQSSYSVSRHPYPLINPKQRAFADKARNDCYFSNGEWGSKCRAPTICQPSWHEAFD